MKTDVTLLIEALTTERDSLTRAIAALQPLVKREKPEAPKVERRRRRQSWSAEARARVGEATRLRWAARRAAKTTKPVVAEPQESEAVAV